MGDMMTDSNKNDTLEEIRTLCEEYSSGNTTRFDDFIKNVSAYISNNLAEGKTPKEIKRDLTQTIQEASASEKTKAFLGDQMIGAKIEHVTTIYNAIHGPADSDKAFNEKVERFKESSAKLPVSHGKENAELLKQFSSSLESLMASCR